MGNYTQVEIADGIARALEIAAFDDPIDARRALNLGLVNEIVPDQLLMDRTLSLLDRVRSKSLHTFGWSKDLLNGSFETPLETHLTREREGLVACVTHPDGKEGIAAFLEKRYPKFNPPDS